MHKTEIIHEHPFGHVRRARQGIKIALRPGGRRNHQAMWNLRTRTRRDPRSTSMFLTIAIILVALWLLGFFMHLAGGLIHIVLVIALIMFVLHFVRGRAV